MLLLQATSTARVVQAHERRIGAADETAFLDEGHDGGFGATEGRIGLRRQRLLQSPDHGRDVSPCSIAQLACDVRAVGVTRPRALKRLRADIAQAVAEIRGYLVRAVDGDLPEYGNDFDEQRV
jgi:hypothetical protein